jgi:SAM-dependent methyltransferase
MSEGDRERVREYYDALGENEWERLASTVHGRVAYEVHRRFLARFVGEGDHVLEIGAGPGRFTVELARLGALVTATDISPVQLDLHRAHLEGTSSESSVVARELLDVCDTTRYADDSFDVVLAYGGPLSYAFEDAALALDGLLRITKPGGYVVASVMSWLGSWRYLLPAVLEDESSHGDEAGDLVMATGDLRHMHNSHICQMYRSRDAHDLVASSDAEMIAMSASNWASLADPHVLEDLEGDPARWQRFLSHEVAACAEPGALDGGTHILFSARRTPLF